MQESLILKQQQYRFILVDTWWLGSVWSGTGWYLVVLAVLVVVMVLVMMVLVPFLVGID